MSFNFSEGCLEQVEGLLHEGHVDLDMQIASIKSAFYSDLNESFALRR